MNEIVAVMRKRLTDAHATGLREGLRQAAAVIQELLAAIGHHEYVDGHAPYPFVDACHASECPSTRLRRYGPCNCGADAMIVRQSVAIAAAKMLIADALNDAAPTEVTRG